MSELRERIDGDGRVMVRVGNTYKPKARYLYEQYNNCTLDTYHLVVFLDGNNRNFDKENLICITRYEQNFMNRFYGGFSHSAEENMLNLTLVRLKIKRFQVAKEHGLVKHGAVIGDEKEARHKRFSNPEYRKKMNEKQKAYKKKKYATDPVFREKVKSYQIKRRQEKKVNQ